MADIFISYSRADKKFVKKLLTALEKNGWTVCWDHEIPSGAKFRKFIVSEIDKSKCVIVIWSEKSVERDFVLDEAERGKKQNKLIPIRIDQCEIPLGFGTIHCANLVGWNGQNNSEINKMFESITEFLPKKLNKKNFLGKTAFSYDTLNYKVKIPTTFPTISTKELKGEGYEQNTKGKGFDSEESSFNVLDSTLKDSSNDYFKAKPLTKSLFKQLQIDLVSKNKFDQRFELSFCEGYNKHILIIKFHPIHLPPDITLDNYRIKIKNKSPYFNSYSLDFRVLSYDLKLEAKYGRMEYRGMTLDIVNTEIESFSITHNKEVFYSWSKNTSIRVEKKVGRNDPCPCGSGKLYKQCHGR